MVVLILLTKLFVLDVIVKYNPNSFELNNILSKILCTFFELLLFCSLEDCHVTQVVTNVWKILMIQFISEMKLEKVAILMRSNIFHNEKG